MTTLLALFTAIAGAMLAIITLWDLDPGLAIAIAFVLAMGLSLLTLLHVLRSFEESENQP